MKKKILLAILMIVSLVSTNLCAETAYQKEVDRIVRKYYCITTYGYERSLSYSESIQLSFISPELLLLSIYSEHPNLAERMAKELKDADILKTDEDYYREWQYSNHGKLTLLIKDKMGDQFQKDQFETQAQYQERVKGELKTSFVEWCVKAYADMEKTIEIKVSPKNYNAESQIYTLGVKETFTVFNKSFENSYETSAKMQPQYARSFAETKLSAKDFLETKWFLVDNDIYADVRVQLPSGLTLALRKSGANEPLCFEFKKLQYDVPALDNYKWCYTEADELYKYWDGELQKEVAKYNQKYIEYPFNINKEALDIHLDKQNRFDAEALKSEYDSKTSTLEQMVKSKKTDMRNNLRFKDRKRYIEIYEQLDPDMRTRVNQMAEEYRCYNFTEEELKLAYIDNRKPADKTCKEKYIHLFKSEDEFSTYYSSGRFEEEVANRQRVETMYKGQIGFIGLHSKEKFKFQGCMEFTGDSSSPLGNAKHVADFLHKKDIDILPSFYAEDLLNKCFDLDASMAKEYDKYGLFFANKREFFLSYTSGSYKGDLKNAKKVKK